jgi:PX domain-containing protein kinase-like protein
MKQEFIEQRQNTLQEFLDKITSHSILAQTLWTKKFLNEENYSQNFVESAFEHISMFTRSEPKWNLSDSLKEFGIRFRKQYFLVQNLNNKYLLSWCDYGPDKALKDSDLTLLFQQFSQFTHDYLVPVSLVYNNDFGVLYIQHYYEKGSLRDYLHGISKIKQSFMKKYCSKKSYNTLKLSQIKLFSRQILETLQFLHLKGLAHGHLHSGNIIIENDAKIRLTDLHNSLIGLPNQHRSLMIDHKKISDLELVDVYSFGLILFEMVYGETYSQCLKENFNDCQFNDVKQMLELILDMNPKKELPRLSKLLDMP